MGERPPGRLPRRGRGDQFPAAASCPAPRRFGSRNTSAPAAANTPASQARVVFIDPAKSSRTAAVAAVATACRAAGGSAAGAPAQLAGTTVGSVAFAWSWKQVADAAATFAA